VSLSELEAVLERLLAGTASEGDRSAVRAALVSGVLATGERAVAISGKASDVIIVTGDGNVVLSFKGTEATAVQAVLNSIAPPRLYQVPSPPRDFAGREEEMKELITAIEHGGVTISGLQGLGGIGKTALALKLVALLTPRFPDAQFYLDLKGAGHQPLSVTDALAHVIRAYHPAAKLPDSESELHGLYLSVLHDQRAILLMDNAASAEQVGPLIPPPSCVLLVTSRHHFSLPGLFAKKLDMLGADDACALLLAIAPRIGGLAHDIAALCGYLPLALRLAAGALANSTLRPSDYAQRLRDAQQRLKLIEATLNLTYESMGEELQTLWCALAVFPGTFNDAAAAAVWGQELAASQDRLSDLFAYSLLEWDSSTGRYRLHDLTRLFADSRLLTTDRTIAQRQHSAHYRDVLAAASKLYEEGGEALTRGLVLFDLEWKNIQTGQAWATQQSGMDDEAAQLCIGYSERVMGVLSLRQHSRESIDWLEVSLAMARRMKKRDSESIALNDQANTFLMVGEFRRAIGLYEQSLIIARETANRKGEGMALGNLGIAYGELGEVRKAIEFGEQALLVAREIGDRGGEGVALNHLGLAYAHSGETKRSIELYQQFLAIARETGYRRGEGAALGNLGLAHAALGEFERAIVFYQQQLLIVLEIGDRRGESSALSNLGFAYGEQGEITQAIELFEKSLVIDRELGNRSGEGVRLWNISVMRDKFGERAAAIASGEKALAILEQIEHPNAANVREQIQLWRAETMQDGGART
jgi:tetratricopeptide (TPR) repeat protein